MSWTYHQATGAMFRPDGSPFHFRGYSGHEAGLNNPLMEKDPGIGPIPAGHWNIGTALTHIHLGPVVMALTPNGFDPHGRSAFYIHGDNAAGNGTASHGCIVLPRECRQEIAASSDHHLIVEI